MDEDIRKVFSDDSKSKKRTANGSFGRVKGSRRGMVTAYSLMSKEQQRAYTQCDEGESYNIYERVIPVEKLRYLPLDVRHKCWSSWLEHFYVEDIMIAWSVETLGDLNRILDEVDLPMLEMEEDPNKDIAAGSDDGTVKVGPEEDTGLTLSDLIAEDAKRTDIQINGELETFELIAELNRALSGITGTQRKYSVAMSIREVIQ